MARAAAQDGDAGKAASELRALLAEAPENAPWAGVVRSALTQIALGPEGQMPKIDPSAMAGASPEQRLGAIRSMVQGLETRLHEAPKDLGGQLRLMRAWTMLGEGAKARAAADSAKAAFADDPQALQRIDDLMLGLGLEG